MENVVAAEILDETQYLTLCHNVYEWCRRWLNGDPVVEDVVYDNMKTTLAQAEIDHPEWIVNWSPVGKESCGIPKGVKPNQLEKIMGAMQAEEFKKLYDVR